jgi:6-phosphofructokinase 1
MPASSPRLGVLTSGGDAPGMNPAVRAIVRRAITLGASVSAIHEGYAGLVTGGAMIRPCSWADVAHILHHGGTDIGTARCLAFREPDGRQEAVYNLVETGIDRLVVVGGDGSLTGADRLRAEWSGHVDALVSSGRLTSAQRAAHPHLHIVGLVGSIDNDMWGTDMTIGCDSALHRIVDAVDTLTSTARSHQRSFVVEVMGRHCGFLALAAAACTDADYLFIPEWPEADWQAGLCAALREGRALGKRKSIVLIAEGACADDGAPIPASAIKEVIEDRLGYETRITVLGHTQRGGSPSAYDRIMSARLGARAAEVLLAMAPGAEPVLLTTAGDAIVSRPLMECVAKTLDFSAAVRAGQARARIAERGALFGELLSLHAALSAPPAAASGQRILIAHVGAPAPGMNAAVRTAGRLGMSAGHTMLAAIDGLKGAAAGDIRPLSWPEISSIASLGATILGTDRWLPDTPERREALLAALLAERVTGVVLIGGFEALQAGALLCELGLPVGFVPATISNNVPGTERSVGCDTAVNVICEAADRLKLSAIGSRNRTFIVEVMGRRCGYLAAAGGLGSGAELTYTHEQGVSLGQLQRDTAALRVAFEEGQSVGLILVADGASTAYDARTLERVFAHEGSGWFDTRLCVLGHLQQGGRPSPRDRIAGARLAAAALQVATGSRCTLQVAGLKDNVVVLSDGEVLLREADRTNRRPAGQPHEHLRDLAVTLALSPSALGLSR